MNDLEEIKNKIDIVEDVGKYVQLKQSGRNFKGLCPFHSEKTPSFMVSPEKQIWHCFGCNEGGDVISFTEKIEGLSFSDAVKELALRAGVKLSKNFKDRKEPTDNVFLINEQACLYFEKLLKKNEGKQAYEYLKKRGLTDETITEFRLGFSSVKRDILTTELTAMGFAKPDLVKAGVSNSSDNRFYDQFRGRLMFPITNVQGKVIGFSARVLDDSLPKYINTPETLIYHKSGILFGMDKAKEQTRKQDHLILVEGNMDMIFSYQAGVKNVVASSGTALTEAQLDQIKRFTKNIKISFDVDMAGQNATKRAIELAQEKGFNIKVIEVPEGKDPADLVKNDPKKWINACKKAKYVVDYTFDSTFSRYDVTNILDKKRATKELLATISRLPDPVEKEHYLQILAQRIGVSLQALMEALHKAKSNKYNQTSVSKKTKTVIEKPKTTLEERVFSLLLVSPQYSDFFFNKISPEDFINDRLVRFAGELDELNENGELEIGKWIKKQKEEDINYINQLILEIEDEFPDGNEEIMGEELFNGVLRLRQDSYELAKKNLNKKIFEAEKEKNVKLVKKLMAELQVLIEKERNI